MVNLRRLVVLPALGLALVAGQLATASPVAATTSQRLVSPPTVVLGSAATYSVLGGTGVVNNGNDTVLGGDLGLSPTGAISGFGLGLGTVQGTTHDKDAEAAQAQVARRAAYDDADNRTGAIAFGGDQIGQTFAPGLYRTAGAFANTGVMTLDGGGNPDAVWIFQVDAAYSPAAGSSVLLTDGAKATNVFWQVLGAVSIGQGSTYAGTYLTQGAFTLGARATLKGRALSAGNVTLADNAISTPQSVPPVAADTLPVDLGDATPFAVLAATGVGNSGPSTIDGDVGTSPNGSVSGFAPGSINGETHVQDTVAAEAQNDRRKAYDEAAARTSTRRFAGDQAGTTFGPGVIRTAGAFANSGTMTLDAAGDPEAVFLFQVNAAFSPAAGSKVVLTDGAVATNVYWQVLGVVTIATGSTYPGTFITEGSINVASGVRVPGRLLSHGSVTLSSTDVSTPAPDTAAPIVTIDGGASRTTDDATPTLSGTTDQRVGRDVTVRVGGQTLTTTVRAGGLWQVTAAALANGTYPATASATDPSGNVATARQSLTVAVGGTSPRAVYQPDASIRLAGKRPVGVGVYGGTADQRVAHVFKAGTAIVKFHIRLQNRGNVVDRYKLGGTARHNSFKVVYRIGGKDVTKAVKQGTYRTARVAAGRSVAIVVTVTRLKAARPGDRGSFRLTAGSVRRPGKRDAVALGVSIPRS